MEGEQKSKKTCEKAETPAEKETAGTDIPSVESAQPQPIAYSHKFDYKTLKKDPTMSMLNRMFNRETHKYLGLSGVKVSRVCLGTMNFGVVDEKFCNRPGQLDEATAHGILDRFVQLGGNCIDTANFFPWFGPNSGDSERIIGNWLSQRADRDHLVIITKVRLPTDASNVNAIGLNHAHLVQSVDKCLERLQTTYVDLLQIDGWDYSTDVKETVRCFDELVATGKVGNVGVCDFKGWQLQRMVDTCKMLNKHKFTCYQGEFSLLSRGSEMEVVDVCLNHNLGFIAYSPFKYGALTSSYSDEPEQGTRFEAASGKTSNISAMVEPYEVMKTNPCFQNLYAIIQTIANHRKISIAQTALRWVLQKEFVSTVVIGVSNITELEESMSVLHDFELSEDEMTRLDRASQSYLPYPYLSIPTDVSRKLYMHTPGPVVYSQLAYLTQAITLNDRTFDFSYDQKHFEQSHIHYGMKHEKAKKHAKQKPEESGQQSGSKQPSTSG